MDLVLLELARTGLPARTVRFSMVRLFLTPHRCSLATTDLGAVATINKDG